MDQQRFYIASDYELMIDNFKNELNFLKSSWQNVLGRPLVVFTFRQIHLGLHTPHFYVFFLLPASCVLVLPTTIKYYTMGN